MDLAPFPDIEDLLTQVLADFAPAGTTYPPDLQERLPYLRVLRRGGADDGRTDVARVEIETAAATRAQAWDLARAVQQRLISGPHRVPGAGVIDRTLTSDGPHVVLHENPVVRCVAATYEVAARRLR